MRLVIDNNIFVSALDHNDYHLAQHDSGRSGMVADTCSAISTLR
ncbi:MAG: hypothetical protein KatS3mg022_2396 [Armatimonadota bacterium]|nr:MAG: hypothetical protein KatS3mg022_2396 [Armatimonadota bacterium]